MIIWGSKAKLELFTTGHFFCPKCLREGPYSHMRIAKYFTLYFIPLFVMETLGEYVHCDTCNNDSPIDVLSYSREAIMQVMEPWACWSCNSRNPGPQARCLACGASRT